MNHRSSPRIKCKGCGLCCVSLYDQDVFCDITEADEKRLGKDGKRAIVQAQPINWMQFRNEYYGAIKTKWRKIGSGPFKGVHVCCCRFLQGSLMKNAVCSVYSKRPSTCRKAVTAGDETCKGLKRLMENVVEEAKM